MRALVRLPSRSAATTNCSRASGSSLPTHAPPPVRSWNWPTWLRRIADAIGVRQRQHAARAGRVDVGEHQVHPGTTGDVERSVAQSLDGTTIGAVVASVAGDHLHP